MANIGYWLYGFSCVSGFAILVWLTAYAWKRRAQPTIRSFAIFSVTLVVYSFAILLITFSQNEKFAYFGARLRMIPASVTYLWYFAVILDYCGWDGWRFLRRYWVLFIVPTLTVIITFSPKVNDWMFTDWTITRHGPINLETLHYRGFYFAHLTQYYVMAVIGVMLLIRQAIVRASTYRRQAIANIVVIVIAFVFGTQRNLQIMTNVPNLFPIGLTLLAMVLGWSIFSFHLLDLLPIAYSTIFEQMQAAVLVVDHQMRVTDLNPTAAQLIAPKTAIGQPLEILLPSLAPLMADVTPPHEIQLADPTRYFEVRTTTLHQVKHHIVGHLLVLTDITERKKAEREREQMIVALDAYAHTVAHDLKNPVALVLGYASLLHEELEMYPEGLQSYTAKIIDAAEKNVQIINELLLFASVRRQQDITLRPIEMGQLINIALKRVPIDPDTQITIQSNLPPALGYPAWLEEVWVNLISNALKYGGSPAVLEIGGAATRGRVRFWIHDNGAGLSHDEAQQLFVKEGRLEKHRSQNGHGFGLAIVRNIIERLGGAVGVESELGKGSTFFFTLPGVENNGVPSGQ